MLYSHCSKFFESDDRYYVLMTRGVVMNDPGNEGREDLENYCEDCTRTLKLDQGQGQIIERPLPGDLNLVPENKSPEDFVLVWDSCWITVSNLSIYIVKRKGSVAVEVYPLNQEMEDPIEEIIIPVYSEEKERSLK